MGDWDLKERPHIEKITDAREIKAIIKEAKRLGLFDAIDIEPVNGSFMTYLTLGEDEARFNQYGRHVRGNYLEVRTYRLNSKGEKRPGRYITIYRDGKYAKIDTRHRLYMEKLKSKRNEQ